MKYTSIILLFLFKYTQCYVWPKGIVHYDVNKKDYDPHSQDIISTVLSKIEKELCIKFFLTTSNFNATDNNKVLYISNPEKKKNCLIDNYDFSKSIVHMPIGYKCLTEKDIGNFIVGMLKASIGVYASNQQDSIGAKAEGILSVSERNLINSYYYNECTKLHEIPVIYEASRRSEDLEEAKLIEDNIKYYSRRIWPLGVIKYGIEGEFKLAEEQISRLEEAMNHIQNVSCVEFDDISEDKIQEYPRNYLWFVMNGGEDIPKQGLQRGKQVLNLQNFTHGAPAHEGHILFNLMRVIGFPMESNRFDRDNYVSVNWKKIDKGKEALFEKDGLDSWLHLPYDFESVTHAPVNWMCGKQCKAGDQTIQPLRDHLWQRTMLLGHSMKLSEGDSKRINRIYSHECRKRKQIDSKNVNKSVTK